MRILVVCSGNTCRSPMAQALMLQYIKQNNYSHLKIESAGLFTWEGLTASTEAVEVLKNEGLDISTHKSRQINNSMINNSDLILTMTKAHCEYLQDKFPDKADAIFVLSVFAGTGSDDVIDPFGGGIEAYYQCYMQLRKLVNQAMAKICAHESDD